MKVLGRIITIFFLFLQQLILGQELPPIQGYLPEDYKGLTQNWGVSQQFSSKYIYVANNIGLLEFNGKKWSIYPTPNSTAIRSVKAIEDRIYTGFYMNFGYWKRNASGLLKYTSLSEKVKGQIIEDEEFWGIQLQDDNVLFQSLKRIYIYNVKTEKIHLLDIENGVKGIFEVNGTIYYQDAVQGIFKIQKGKPILVNDLGVITNDKIISINQRGNGLSVVTSKNGIYEVNEEFVKRISIPANDLLDGVTLYSGVQLKNGGYALGTIANGFIQLSAEGAVISTLNQSKGLLNNTVLAVFEDEDENVWLGLDKGLNCINVSSPLRLFNDFEGKVGTVYTSTVFKEHLYLGTNQGLFFKRMNTDESFSVVEGTDGQVWSLFVYDDQLFCGHNSGTFLIDRNSATKISDIQGGWNFQAIPGDSTKVLQGNYTGLSVLGKSEGNWKFRNKIRGFDISARFLQLFKDEVWVNHEYKGVFRLQLNEELTRVEKKHRDTLNQGINSNILSFYDQMLYGSNGGITIFNAQENKFVAVEQTHDLFQIRNEAKGKLLKDANNHLWCFSEQYLGHIYSDQFSKQYQIEKIPLAVTLRKEMPGFENITCIDDKQYLIGTTFGYLVLDLSKLEYKEYAAKLYNVSVRGKDSEFSPVSLTGELPVFNSKLNTISFAFSVPEYDKFVTSEFQYKLEGFHDHWSVWDDKNEVVFENLPFGSYVFKLRSKTGGRLSRKVIAYQFEIAPPWYVSKIAFVVYGIVLLVIMILIHRSYKRYYANQRRKLLEENQKRLELKHLENEKELMKLYNEKLKQDVENKNREIAASTMNIIKKNEILNAIKKELKKAEQNNTGFKSVEQLIDRNLNNQEDWKHLEEAFNNLDKDFLKKLKEKHQDLTPNDLRFCTYLRLNLSSKEIAPLLNISVRSVEIKRYRLRKKLHLAHAESLVSYILEI